MASKLKVDELEGVTTAGSIDVTSEGGAVSTNLQQGLAKMWVNHDKLTSDSTYDSFNVSSVTDVGTGVSTYNLTNSMNNANYSALISAGGTMSFATGKLFGSNGTGGVTAPTSSAFNQVTGFATGAGNVGDSDYNTAAVLGDLA